MTVGVRFCFFRGLGDSCRPSSCPSSGDNSGLSDLRLRLVRGGLSTGGVGTWVESSSSNDVLGMNPARLAWRVMRVEDALEVEVDTLDFVLEREPDPIQHKRVV